MPAKLRIVAVTRAMLRGLEACTDPAAQHPYAGVGGDYKEMLTTSAVGAIGDEGPALLLAALGEEPIGRISLFEGLAQVDGRPVPMLWCSGLGVQEARRQTGAGVMLMLKVRSQPLAVGAVGVSRQALDLYRKLGWRDIPATRHVLVLQSRPIVEARFGPGLLARLLGFGIDIALGLHRAALRAVCAWRARGLRVERCASLPAELDVRIDAASAAGLRCHRSTRWVNWCMATGPKTNQRSLHLVRAGNGEPLGYFMHGLMTHDRAGDQAFAGLRLASLRDWLSFDPERLPDDLLILMALRTMMRPGADAIEACVPEDDVGAKLRRLGLLARGMLHFLVRAPSDGALGADAAERAWWWRPADGDGFVN